MRERPILFKGEMVKAILEGRKTQTRRIAKLPCKAPYDAETFWKTNPAARADDSLCPYGVPGDRLWVRETWSCLWSSPGYDNGVDEAGNHDFDGGRAMVKYKDGDTCEALELEDAEDVQAEKAVGKWKPSIHMPRWASRINLEITNVAVQRLQDVTEEDAESEGIQFIREHPDTDETLTAKELFGFLWDSINEKRGLGWDKNPYVWSITFKLV